MTDVSNKQKAKKGGRKPKSDPAIYRYVVRMNAEENAKFNELCLRSGLKEKAKFIRAMVFSTEMKVVKIDKATMDYYIRLTNFYNQFQAIGNNYNQTTRAIKNNFGEKRARALLYKLEQRTIELVIISKEIIRLTQDYELQYLGKKPENDGGENQ